MRIFQPISAITGAILLLTTDATTERAESMTLRRRAEQRVAKYGWEGSTTLQRVLQDRVSGVDSDGLSCVAGMPSITDEEFESTTIQYYYALESSEIIGHAEIQELEEILFGMVSSRILWCTSVSETNVTIPSTRKLALMQQYPELAPFEENHRALSLEEARRLSIISIMSSPLDRIVQGLNCSYQFTANYCVVLEGKVKILAHQSDNLALVVASILDASEFLMENNMLLGDDDTNETVTKVQWLGETLEEAIAFGTDDGDGGGVLGGGVIAPVNEQKQNSDSSNGITTIFAVSVPLLILLGFAFLMTKIRKERAVMTPVELEAGDKGVLFGTGDPPKSFHKGLYHYTRSGSRYLSTNCCVCAETRMSGFSTGGDLPTITEGRIFGIHLASSESESCDDSVEPGMRLISPNSKNLGGIHSGIDSHRCNSATCNICKFRGGEVEFFSFKEEKNGSPGKAWREEDNIIICDSDDDLGENREEDNIISDSDDDLGENCVV